MQEAASRTGAGQARVPSAAAPLLLQPPLLLLCRAARMARRPAGRTAANARVLAAELGCLRAHLLLDWRWRCSVFCQDANGPSGGGNLGFPANGSAACARGARDWLGRQLLPLRQRQVFLKQSRPSPNSSSSTPPNVVWNITEIGGQGG